MAIKFPVRIPPILKHIFTGLHFTGPADEKRLYLTFDDGPLPEFCPWILECLREHQALATFFLVGENAARHPELVEAILRDGHRIGNHTQNHLNGFQTASSEYLQNTLVCAEVLQPYIPQGFAPMFRPPYGRIRPGQIRKLKKEGYEIVLWDVLSKDYEAGITAGDVYANVVNNVRPGSVLVFHDNRKAEAKLKIALPRILTELKQQGYHFGVLEFPRKPIKKIQ
jgi:peptidoglycan/xylan/chitin deacetylase (PgdA/CDA1 family)